MVVNLLLMREVLIEFMHGNTLQTSKVLEIPVILLEDLKQALIDRTALFDRSIQQYARFPILLLPPSYAILSK